MNNLYLSAVNITRWKFHHGQAAQRLPPFQDALNTIHCAAFLIHGAKWAPKNRIREYVKCNSGCRQKRHHLWPVDLRLKVSWEMCCGCHHSSSTIWHGHRRHQNNTWQYLTIIMKWDNSYDNQQSSSIHFPLESFPWQPFSRWQAISFNWRAALCFCIQRSWKRCPFPTTLWMLL